MAYNAKATPEVDRAVARALGGRNGTQALLDLAETLESPNSLKSIGMAENDIERAADLAIERGPIRDLIADA
jgi:alcohol dehydrogenase class IV